MAGIVIESPSFSADIEIDCLIIGGGAAGLTAALAVSQAGLSVLIAERQDRISGSTALSSGLIPAADTNAQRRQQLEDDTGQFFSDIMAKNNHQADPAHVWRCINGVRAAINWLEKDHDIPFHVLDSFLYPGHSHYRMHAVPEVTGKDLVRRLEHASSNQEIPVSCNLKITNLVVSDTGKLIGAQAERPDGRQETIAAKAIILACNGYGGNRDLVAKYIPEMRDAIYFGHAGNQGEAVLWGQALGAEIAHLSGYQGHGSVAHPHGILITWAIMMEGGFQVNQLGKRFSNEHHGYSEQAVNVLSQPRQLAYNIFDARLTALGAEFEDFRNAEQAGAIIKADTIAELAEKIEIDGHNLANTLAECNRLADTGEIDGFGRRFLAEKKLSPPFAAVKVTGTLFHTQGGLVINDHAQVLRTDGSIIAGLYACGGAACGVSGPDVSGYLSGNGLLTALALGYLAGHHIAQDF
jgi:fumarate reductase flavoprotein subunit